MSVTFDMAQAAAQTRMSERAFAHSLGVANMAGLIATVYGLDEQTARVAGMLHDWHRELDDAELLESAREGSVEFGPDEETAPYLLHARTGARELQSTFPDISEDVVRAIENHTIGDPHMQALDKALYIADMTEPGRDYDGVDDLREAIGTLSLDDLFALCYQHSVANLVSCRKRIHPKTVDVWNALVARSRS